MLIPSIDLMGGKIVQLVQGQKRRWSLRTSASGLSVSPAIRWCNWWTWMRPKGGLEPQLVAEFCGKLPCQVGGGIRSADDAQAVLDCGAKKVIIGSSLIKTLKPAGKDSAEDSEDAVDVAFARGLCERFGIDRLVFAVDARGGRVAIHGWKTITRIEPAAMMQQLGPFCCAFLYTHIDTEGLLQGIPMDVIRDLRQKTSRRLIAAGGIHRTEEVEELDKIGVDAVVGMAIYSGLLKI